MKQRKTRKILLNLTEGHLFNLDSFFMVGGYIRQEKIDLHIIGKCGSYCANYLLPAAKTIYIESYGSISYNGSATGFKRDISKIRLEQIEKVQSFTDSPEVDTFLADVFIDRRKYVRDQVESGKISGDVDSYFINDLKAWDNDGERKGQKIADKLKKFLYDKGPISILEMSNTEVIEFLESLSFDLLKTIRLFLFKDTDHLNRHDIGFAFLDYNALKEFNYFNSKVVQITGTLISRESYSYTDFIDLVSWLVKSEWYNNTFHVPRAYYNIPEKDKPWDKVAPSADLLRSLGLNIQGENNMDIFEITGNIEEVLYLDNGRIENCDFFAKNASYTTETLKQCLNLP